MKNSIYILLIVIIFGISGWFLGGRGEKKQNLDLNIDQYLQNTILDELPNNISKTGEVINELIEQAYNYESYEINHEIPKFLINTFNGFNGYIGRVINSTNISKEHELPYIYPFLNGKQIYMYSYTNWRKNGTGYQQIYLRDTTPLIDKDFTFNGRVTKVSGGQSLIIFFDDEVKNNKAYYQLAKLKQNDRVDNHEVFKTKLDYEIISEETLNNQNMKMRNRYFSVRLPDEPGIYRCAIYDVQFKSDVASMSYYMFIHIL